MITDIVYGLLRNGVIDVAKAVSWADKKLIEYDLDTDISDFTLFDRLMDLSLLQESEIDSNQFENDGRYGFGYIGDFAVKISHLDLDDLTAVKKFNDWVRGRACQFYEIDKEIGCYGYGCGHDELAWRQSDLDKKLIELKEKYQSHADEIWSKIT